MKTDEFNIYWPENEFANEYERHSTELLKALNDLNVDQYAITRLPSSAKTSNQRSYKDGEAVKVRVRLDLVNSLGPNDPIFLLSGKKVMLKEVK